MVTENAIVSTTIFVTVFELIDVEHIVTVTLKYVAGYSRSLKMVSL